MNPTLTNKFRSGIIYWWEEDCMISHSIIIISHPILSQYVPLYNMISYFSRYSFCCYTLSIISHYFPQKHDEFSYPIISHDISTISKNWFVPPACCRTKEVISPRSLMRGLAIPKSENYDLSIYRSIYLSTYLPIYLSTYLPIYLSTYLPIYLSTYLPIYLSTYLPIYLSTYLPIYLSTYLLIYLSTYLPIYLSTYLPIYLSIYLSI